MVPTFTCGLVRSNFSFAIFQLQNQNCRNTKTNMVPLAGIGPATSPLPRECSTTEPQGPRHPDNPDISENCSHHQQPKQSGAGDGNRTRVISLEGWGSTIELLPPEGTKPNDPEHFERDIPIALDHIHCWWRGLDSNQRTRKRADLQSAAFNHSATPP